MGDKSGILPHEKGVKNNGNFRCITSILNLEQRLVAKGKILPARLMVSRYGSEKVNVKIILRIHVGRFAAIDSLHRINCKFIYSATRGTSDSSAITATSDFTSALGKTCT